MDPGRTSQCQSSEVKFEFGSPRNKFGQRIPPKFTSTFHQTCSVCVENQDRSNQERRKN